ncbi:MAG: transcriptional regulator [Rhodocyclaceae bacterium]|nr:transcriptional regulator [Rhodocyclaceae bacterium]
MPTTAIKLVTIIAEDVLKEQLTNDIKRLGGRGYTLVAVSGRGTRNLSAHFEEGHLIKIETLVSAEVADQLVTHIADEYFANYSITTYTTDVAVLRPDKFV